MNSAQGQQESTCNPEARRTRLHISPLNPSLLVTIFNPELRKSASNISYHTIQTYPEADYGFVDLPAAEAGRLKRKLHGSILRGCRLRVEEARPPWNLCVGALESGPRRSPSASGRPTASSVRSRQPSGVFRALVLPNSRRVQRGWTKPRSAAKPTRKTSGHSSTSEPQSHCIFRTRAPPNILARLPPSISKRPAKMGKRRTKHASDSTVTVREFSSTKKAPTFLKDRQVGPDRKIVTQFVDGRGWVDEDGNVVESVARRSSRAAPLATVVEESVADQRQGTAPKGSDRGEDGTASPRSQERPRKQAKRGGSEGKTNARKHSNPPNASGPSIVSTPVPPRTAPNLSIKIPSPDMPLPREVHPLESIFKKPTLPVDAKGAPKTRVGSEPPFNFFGPQDAERTAHAPQVPATPFTQQDFLHRGIRSAAPTPDTAAPGKRFSFSWRQDNVDEEEDEDDDEDEDVDAMADSTDPPVPTDQKTQGGQGTSLEAPGEEEHIVVQAAEPEPEIAEKGFEESFWERRTHTNHVWRRRRRETGKIKRRLENKRLVRRP